MSNSIQQPHDLDLVGNPILIGGIASGFEATVNYRVTDGHDEVTGFFTVGGGTGEHAQYQLAVDVSGAAFTLPRLFIEVFEVSAEDGSEIRKVSRRVVHGPLLVPGYIGFRIHTVAPGDTLWDIAQDVYGDGSKHPRIVAANPAVITDPDVILPGQRLRIPIGS